MKGSGLTIDIFLVSVMASPFGSACGMQPALNPMDMSEMGSDASSRRVMESSRAGVPSRLPGLDGLRGVAILFVFLCHAYLSPATWTDYLHLSQNTTWALKCMTTPFGYFGVPIFFVVSGFLITFLLLREERANGCISLKQFWVKRFLRIVPPALVCFLFIIGYAWLAGVHLDSVELASVGLFFRDLVPGHALTAHFWSLALEERFYLTWPLILIFVPRGKRLFTVVGLMVLAPLIRLVCAAGFPQYASFVLLLVRPDSILTGCLLALVWDKLDYCRFSHKTGDIMFVGGLLSIMIAWLVSSYSGLMPNRIYAEPFNGLAGLELISESIMLFLNLGIVCVVLAAVTESTPAARCLNARWLVSVGLISYSLYLWQELFFFAPVVPHWMQGMAARMGCALVVGAGAYFLIERPMNRFRHRLKTSPGRQTLPGRIQVNPVSP